jgi:hypothetical protein
MQVGYIPSVNKKMASRLKIGWELREEFQVGLRKPVFQRASRRPGRPSVGAQRCGCAQVKPFLELLRIVKRLKQRFFMVSHKGYEIRLVIQVDQPIDHLPTVIAAVNEITERDDRVVACGTDGIDQGGKGIVASVNVADGNRTAGRNDATSLPADRLEITAMGDARRFNSHGFDMVLGRTFGGWLQGFKALVHHLQLAAEESQNPPNSDAKYYQ